MSMNEGIRTALLNINRAVSDPYWRWVRPDHVALISYVTRNWGDAVNATLVGLITGKPVRVYDINLVKERPEVALREAEVLLAIGSVLREATSNSVVWGSGFISETCTLRSTPRQVVAVRGPRTAAKLRAMGVSCPELYGDPALLYPRYYPPANRTKRYRLGIIPHYMDRKDPRLARFASDPDTVVLDIKSGINRLIDDMCQCETIASSSLHGLIMSDAYSIPSVWVGLGRLHGRGFKFHDYFESIHLAGMTPVNLEDMQGTSDLVRCAELRDLSALRLDELLNACPHRSGVIPPFSGNGHGGTVGDSVGV